MRLEAIERLLAASRPLGGGGRAAAERFIEFSGRHSIAVDAMWALLDDAGRVTASILAVPNPGRTAIIFVSPARSADVLEHARLIDHACGELVGRGIHLAQVLLEPAERDLRAGFLGAGFQLLAQLSYMERPLPGRPPPPPGPWPADVTLETYDDEMQDDLLTVLDASYEETRDCPGLRGLRHTADILAGHHATGEFDPALWTILRRSGRPVGALLLNPSPASNAIELVYMGLAREQQGEGLGRRLLQHGLHQVRARPERTITLAVDDDNAPAIALYRREGFRRVLRRTAMIRSLRASTPVT